MLSERAEELSSIAEELDQADPSILSEVFFLAGVARNAEHLKMCGVERARGVATIRSPMAVSGSSHVTEDTEAAVVNADMQTIMTSLNLHMILLKSHMSSRYDGIKSNLRGDDDGADDGRTQDSSSRSRRTKRQRSPQAHAHAQTFTGVAPLYSVLFCAFMPDACDRATLLRIS